MMCTKMFSVRTMYTNIMENSFLGTLFVVGKMNRKSKRHSSIAALDILNFVNYAAAAATTNPTTLIPIVQYIFTIGNEITTSTKLH